MKMPKSKYEQTKVPDEPLIKEMSSVQEFFQFLASMTAVYLNFRREGFQSFMYSAILTLRELRMKSRKLLS